MRLNRPLPLMDAVYLRKHVQGALTEALLAMAVEQPEDSVEFVGNYLLELVQRDVRQVQCLCHAFPCVSHCPLSSASSGGGPSRGRGAS